MKMVHAYHKAGPLVQAYTVDDLIRLQNIILEAERAWAKAAEGQDEGTSVIRGGLTIWCIQPRTHYARRELLIRSPSQGNVTCFKTAHVAIKILHEAGIEANYFDGNVDQLTRGA